MSRTCREPCRDSVAIRSSLQVSTDVTARATVLSQLDVASWCRKLSQVGVASLSQVGGARWRKPWREGGANLSRFVSRYVAILCREDGAKHPIALNTSHLREQPLQDVTACVIAMSQLDVIARSPPSASRRLDSGPLGPLLTLLGYSSGAGPSNRVEACADPHLTPVLRSP